MLSHSKKQGNFVLILSDVRGYPPKFYGDYKLFKDLIKNAIGVRDLPSHANIVDHDRTTVTCDLDWPKAFKAFKALNGRQYLGTHWNAILQYPDDTTWLIHPNTDASASVPIARRRRTHSGFGQPYIVPQIARERRNPSISSVSSQTSSPGRPSTSSSLSSVGSLETVPNQPFFATYDDVIPTPALIDTETSRIFPPNATSIPHNATRRDGSPRYQRFFLMTCAAPHGPQSPTDMAPRPRYEHPTERRTIHIREMSHNVTDQKLQGLLNAQGLQNHCRYEIRRTEHSKICHAFVTFETESEARDAVYRLHKHPYLERELLVALAQDRITVRKERPIIADGSDF